ncbi:MAG: 2-oxo acid dehydrogenase subunit E2 [Chitinivibrionales bacterium]|nr:2-oxo acid dehydrogenase subunit E2 [Chitinivibrionales bacterium]
MHFFLLLPGCRKYNMILQLLVLQYTRSLATANQRGECRMATPIAMPRQGQSVETCIILEWHKHKGDEVKEGDILFTYETDKASFEFESPVSGTLLETFFEPDQDIPVLTTVAAIGSPGEDVGSLRPSDTGSGGAGARESESAALEQKKEPSGDAQPGGAAPAPQPVGASDGLLKASPRAKIRAQEKGVDLSLVAGTGPAGRVIESDIDTYLSEHPKLTKAAAAAGAGGAVPSAGTGFGGRITASDLSGAPQTTEHVETRDEVVEVKISNMRRIIGSRMMESLQQSAQLTMNASADARAILAYRKKIKAKREELGIADINITDMISFAVARTLVQFPALNCHFENNRLLQHKNVHLAMAVDTPRGLVVPVIRFANRLSLSDLAVSIKDLAGKAREGAVNPDLLSGGTITITNLGSFGIESFTPILNRPQVAIVGVNTITPKPAMGDQGEYILAPHIGFSLTIDHQVVDGAPAARFLKTLCRAIENIELTLAAA